jgi:hypothetical protein
VSARQIKQVQMIEKRNVPFKRIYAYEVPAEEFDSESIGSSPIATLRLQNKKSDGLGVPLPAGTASVMEPSPRMGLVLAGEHTLQDLPVGLPIDIELGQAMDIWVQPRVVREYTQGRGTTKMERADIEIDIANDKSVPIQLEVFQTKVVEADFRVVSESTKHSLKKGMPMWALSLKPGERKTLRYTVEHAT